MRYLVAALLAAGVAAAVADDLFLKGEALAAAALKDCADGCVLFNRQEAQALEVAIQQMTAQAYEAGKRESKCRL